MKDRRDRYPTANMWPVGEWDNEDDYEFWQDGEFWCAFARNYNGALCGYIGFNPKIKIDIDDICVHGGVTFDRRTHPNPGDDEFKIIPKKLRWIGFDCAHFEDFVPGMSMISSYSDSFKGTYRNVAFVKAEIENMKQQILLTIKESK